MVATVKCDTITNVANTGAANLSLDASGNVTVGNGLTMSAASARFLGDFSNATVSTRLSFQTSTTNGSTGIYALPNGTSTAASWQATNAADPTNASKILIATNGSTDTQLVSGRNGTGTYLPLSFYTNGTQNAQLDTSGNLTTVGTINMGSSFKRNRIINGDMRVDQRNAGASGTAVGYTVDRWYYNSNQSSKGTWQQNAGALTGTNLPTGFVNYLGFTSSSAYTVLTGDYFMFYQIIEGLNTSDLGWGTVNAKTITISFWVRSSLTGTFGGSIRNNAVDRSYPFSYTISAANTWEQKSITIVGDTTGTWVTTNAGSIVLSLSLGMGATYSGTAGAWVAGNYVSVTGAQSIVGTNGATFYITGVQLEVGSIATPYERQIYSEQLAQCQRYYETTYEIGTAPGTATQNTTAYITYAQNSSTTVSQPLTWIYKVTKRASPTITQYNPNSGSTGSFRNTDASTDVSAAQSVVSSSATMYASNAAGISANQRYASHFTAAAEL